MMEYTISLITGDKMKRAITFEIWEVDDNFMKIEQLVDDWKRITILPLDQIYFITQTK